MTGFGLPDSFSAFVGAGRGRRRRLSVSAQTASSGKSAMSLAATTGPTPRNGAQDLRQAIELPIASDVTLDRVFNGVKAWGERDDEGHALAIERVVCQINAAPFGLPGVDKVSAPGGQRPQALVSAKRRRLIGAFLRQRDTGRSASRRSDRVWRARREPCERRGLCWGGACSSERRLRQEQAQGGLSGISCVGP